MRRGVAVLAVIVGATIAGCVQSLTRRVVTPDHVRTVDRKAPFLKAHMRDGSLYVLSPWSVDDSARQVSGSGTRYDLARIAGEQGPITLPLDSVVLFETNVARTSGSVAALAVVTGITAGFAIYCASNPKACFGSCPTFYVTDGGRDVLQAEGFSASVAPSLEARDVDALYRARPRGREVRIDMVNEAYETHVVRFANLLAAPRRPGRRVMADL
ncbi:MAG TPA: hypothetical protein VFV33_00925, partial [Gemmatimonadaceae bacterium]|nr:hypothetical protein [Gemmatimonadaceae bacterium]